jgi:hypothetical protein
MKAQPGDWLVVHARTDNQHVRSAEIVAVPSGDGTPPFTVRWLDTGHTAVVFPGPDATVVSAADKIERDHVDAARMERLQSEIVASPDTR